MTKRELKELLKDNKTSEKHKVTSSDFCNIGIFVNISLQMDKKTLDYYYEIDADELLSSKMPKEEYEVLRDQGWSFKNDKLIIFLTI